MVGAVYCTSRHDLSHILHCEDREFLLCIHTDHAVAQSSHRQHRFPWRRNAHFWRSVRHQHYQLHLRYNHTEWHTWTISFTVCRYQHFFLFYFKHLHSLYDYDARSFCSLKGQTAIHCLSTLCLSQQYWHLRGDRHGFDRAWLLY